MPSLNNFLFQVLLEKGQQCLENNSMNTQNFITIMNDLVLEVFQENVSKVYILVEAQTKRVKRYSSLDKKELITILWNRPQAVNKTNLKRIKTINRKRTAQHRSQMLRQHRSQMLRQHRSQMLRKHRSQFQSKFQSQHWSQSNNQYLMLDLLRKQKRGNVTFRMHCVV